MDFKNKKAAIAIAVVLVAVAVFLAVQSGSQHNGSVNTIETSSDQEEAAGPSELEKFEKALNTLVKQEYLDSATRDIVLTAAKKYESEIAAGADGQDAASKSQTLSLSLLKDKNLISAEVFDKVKAATDKKAVAKRDKRFGPLVSSGAFTDTVAAEKAYISFSRNIHAVTSEQNDALNKEIQAAKPPMTDAEKKKRKDALEAGQEQRIDSVLATMVSENELSKSQADALKNFFAPPVTAAPAS